MPKNITRLVARQNYGYFEVCVVVKIPVYQKDINDILTMLSENLRSVFGDQVIGVYLTGSLTYGDFDRVSSDIDLLNDNIASKRVSSTWAKKAYGKAWSDLIERAEYWQYGQEMNSIDETLQFIQFVLQELG